VERGGEKRCLRAGRPSECFRVEHVDAGDAVRADGRVLGQLDRPRSVEMVEQLHERIGLRAPRVNRPATVHRLFANQSLQSASHRHQHLTPALRTPLLRLSLSGLFWILYDGCYIHLGRSQRVVVLT
jgi:hypothetical protein